jgi:tripartite-type tricarboxylate transporter receptor subunit TctC
VAGIELVHVPYKGTAFAQTDLVGGRIDLMFDNVPPAIAFIREGKTRVLAVASSRRSPQLRDTPTAAEEGYPAVEIYTWAGLFAPKGTPQGVIQRVNSAMKTVLEMPEVRERLTAQGNNDANAYTTPEQLGAFLQGEIDKWRKVIRQRNIKL